MITIAVIALLIFAAIFSYKDVWWYLQGTTRQFLYNRLPFLLRKKVKDMYHDRIKKAKPCYDNGECLHCGCKTPDLFFANKACSKPENPCYEKA